MPAQTWPLPAQRWPVVTKPLTAGKGARFLQKQAAQKQALAKQVSSRNAAPATADGAVKQVKQSRAVREAPKPSSQQVASKPPPVKHAPQLAIERSSLSGEPLVPAVEKPPKRAQQTDGSVGRGSVVRTRTAHQRSVSPVRSHFDAPRSKSRPCSPRPTSGSGGFHMSSSTTSAGSSSGGGDSCAHREAGDGWKPPMKGLAGRWVSVEDFEGEEGFGWFGCACGRHWQSAHAHPDFAQSCLRCEEESCPAWMWQGQGRLRWRAPSSSSSDGELSPQRSGHEAGRQGRRSSAGTYVAARPRA